MDILINIFAIIGVIFFITIIYGLFNDNKKDIEDLKKKIIEEYLAEQKKKYEHNLTLEKNKRLIEEAEKLISDNSIEDKTLIELPKDVQFLSDDFITNAEIAEFQERKIDKKYFRPKKDADPDHPYYLKKFVITGTFNYFPDRNDLAELIYNVGADIDTAISKNINYVIVGKNAGWRKMELIEEFGIEILYEDDIIEFFNLEK